MGGWAILLALSYLEGRIGALATLTYLWFLYLVRGPLQCGGLSSPFVLVVSLRIGLWGSIIVYPSLTL